MALLPIDRAEAGDAYLPVSASGITGLHQVSGPAKFQNLLNFTEAPGGAMVIISDPLHFEKTTGEIARLVACGHEATAGLEAGLSAWAQGTLMHT